MDIYIIFLILRKYCIVKHAPMIKLFQFISIATENVFHYRVFSCSRSHLPSYKQWFISVVVCHKLIYTLLWSLWAACPKRFIKYPSLLLIQVYLLFKSPGDSSFVFQFPSQPACLSQPHRQHTVMTVWWDAWPWRLADIEKGPWERHASVGQWPQCILSLIY